MGNIFHTGLRSNFPHPQALSNSATFPHGSTILNTKVNEWKTFFSIPLCFSIHRRHKFSDFTNLEKKNGYICTVCFYNIQLTVSIRHVHWQKMVHFVLYLEYRGSLVNKFNLFYVIIRFAKNLETETRFPIGMQWTAEVMETNRKNVAMAECLLFVYTHSTMMLIQCCSFRNDVILF